MWEMGGYEYYIWPSYGLVLIGLTWLMIKYIRQFKRVKHEIKTRLKNKEKP